ncbi:MAG TPA: putative nucleotidyltransferase substrate binding domain-containing protein [Solirubrobacteraceae bacterium]|nr:putative nucleotidyltransferase substrate binding domain-containing protein [Solirubrobacteraceae bacterium]
MYELVQGVPLDAALSEIARFLAARAPFDALGPEDLGVLAAQTEIEFYLAGAPILTEDGGPVTFLRVIHSGAVDIVHDDRLLDLLGVGDTFGHAAMLSGLPPGFEARAAEDTLCYRIPVAAARPLLDGVKQREIEVGAGAPSHQAVTRLIRSPTVVCQPMDRIREVARRMTESGATSAIVDLRSQGFGIVTDRDIRTKIVGAGLPLSAPVATVMSTPVYTVPPERPGGEVLFELLERGIRHAPVVSDSGQLIGVIEDADLFAAQSRSWFGVRRSISRAATVEDLAAVARRLPEVVSNLHASRLRALEVVRVLSALVDALTTRALELAGPAPAREGVVWVALGSQARRELTPVSIPRGAVVASAPVPEEWSRSVDAAMSACGISGGEVVARTADEWASLVHGPSDELGLSLLVERRALWGTPVDPLPAVSDGVREGVVEALSARALAAVPPTGFDGDAVLEADGSRSDRLDIRRAAIAPIVELARWGSAVSGVVEGSTVERLQAAASGGALSEQDALTLSDAFELGLELRVAHHMEQLADGRPPDDRIECARISPLMRDHLRDVFRAVASVQRGLSG